MASATLTTDLLIQRVRRLLGDWPDNDALTASITSVTTTVTVADSSIYSVNWPVEIDYEAMIVRAKPSGTTLTVKRAAYGSTAATHANAAACLIRPSYFTVEIIDALNACIDASFPLLYKPVLDTSLTGIADTYEYTVPFMPTSTDTRIPLVSTVEFKDSGEVDFYPVRTWWIKRGATPKLQFRRAPAAGATIRLSGFGPFPHLAAAADVLDPLWPLNAEDLLAEYAAQRLIASGEARRVRQDTGLIDNREQANRTGSAMQAANSLLQRFQIRLRDSAMPPISRHARPTF